ncbi:MAG: DNA-3-methyladenine glycosylase [Christensenellales bacterium]|jgi:DNA-3-methyladenine glycosylase
MERLGREFFARGAVEVARDIVGKRIVHTVDGVELRAIITEAEAYCGTTDSACHAYKGRTKRTEVLYRDAGTVYVYLCYGIHWLINIVVSEVDDPQCVLLRAAEGAKGPGLFTRLLKIDGSLNGANVLTSPILRIEHGIDGDITKDTRVGINYADPKDRDQLWRFILKPREQ